MVQPTIVCRKPLSLKIRKAMRDRKFRQLVTKRIQRMLDASSLSNAEVARRCGIDGATISGWYRGTRTPTLPYFLMLCEVLEVTPNQFLGLPLDEDAPIAQEVARLVDDLPEKAQQAVLDIIKRFDDIS